MSISFAAQVYFTSQPASIGSQLVAENGTFFGDKSLNKFTQNMTLSSLVQTQPSKQVVIMNDYSKV